MLTLNFDSTGLTFASIYEKLVTFLRNKETITPAQAHIEASVFTAQMGKRVQHTMAEERKLETKIRSAPEF